MHHFTRGMNQIYEVHSCGNKDPSEQPYGMIRTFYIAAEEVEWDYAPNKNWEFEKQHMDAGGERYHRRGRQAPWVGLHMRRRRLSDAEAREGPGFARTVPAEPFKYSAHKRGGALPISILGRGCEVVLRTLAGVSGHLHQGCPCSQVACGPTNVLLSE